MVQLNFCLYFNITNNNLLQLIYLVGVVRICLLYIIYIIKVGFMTNFAPELEIFVLLRPPIYQLSVSDKNLKLKTLFSLDSPSSDPITILCLLCIPTRIIYSFPLKLNTMELETPGGNHCCLMVNDVQNSRLVHSFINIKHCRSIWTRSKEKQLYTNQTSSRWKKVNKMRHFTVIVDLNFSQSKI